MGLGTEWYNGDNSDGEKITQVVSEPQETIQEEPYIAEGCPENLRDALKSLRGLQIIKFDDLEVTIPQTNNPHRIKEGDGFSWFIEVSTFNKDTKEARSGVKLRIKELASKNNININS